MRKYYEGFYVETTLASKDAPAKSTMSILGAYSIRTSIDVSEFVEDAPQYLENILGGCSNGLIVLGYLLGRKDPSGKNIFQNLREDLTLVDDVLRACLIKTFEDYKSWGSADDPSIRAEALYLAVREIIIPRMQHRVLGSPVIRMAGAEAVTPPVVSTLGVPEPTPAPEIAAPVAPLVYSTASIVNTPMAELVGGSSPSSLESILLRTIGGEGEVDSVDFKGLEKRLKVWFETHLGKEWLKDNLPDLMSRFPEILEGSIHHLLESVGIMLGIKEEALTDLEEIIKEVDWVAAAKVAVVEKRKEKVNAALETPTAPEVPTSATTEPTPTTEEVLVEIFGEGTAEVVKDIDQDAAKFLVGICKEGEIDEKEVKAIRAKLKAQVPNLGTKKGADKWVRLVEEWIVGLLAIHVRNEDFKKTLAEADAVLKRKLPVRDIAAHAGLQV